MGELGHILGGVGSLLVGFGTIGNFELGDQSYIWSARAGLPQARPYLLYYLSISLLLFAQLPK